MACPWANRALSALVMKGLAAPFNAEAFAGHDSSFCVSYTVVHPTWQRTRKDDSNDTHCGWTFFDSYSAESVPITSSTGFGSFYPSGCKPDPNDIKAQYIRDLYEKCSNSQYSIGKFTVPILWDKKTNSIVNNESSDIIRMVNHAFDEWTSGPWTYTHRDTSERASTVLMIGYTQTLTTAYTKLALQNPSRPMTKR